MPLVSFGYITSFRAPDVGFRFALDSGSFLAAQRTVETGRCCRKSLRKRNVKLEFETNESRHVDFLNQDCALAPDLESMLRRDSCKLLFRQHRPKGDTLAVPHIPTMAGPQSGAAVAAPPISCVQGLAQIGS